MSRADDPVTECLGKIIDFVLGIIFCIVFFVIVVSTLTTVAIVFWIVSMLASQPETGGSAPVTISAEP